MEAPHEFGVGGGGGRTHVIIGHFGEKVLVDEVGAIDGGALGSRVEPGSLAVGLEGAVEVEELHLFGADGVGIAGAVGVAGEQG